MAVNKVVINDEIKIDLTSDTVSPDTLSKGITAHDKSGNVIVGTMEGGGATSGPWVEYGSYFEQGDNNPSGSSDMPIYNNFLIGDKIILHNFTYVPKRLLNYVFLYRSSSNQEFRPCNDDIGKIVDFSDSDTIENFFTYSIMGMKISRLIFPANLKKIWSAGIGFEGSAGILDFSRCKQVPVLFSTRSMGRFIINSTAPKVDTIGSLTKGGYCQMIIVPDALYDEWRNTTNWTSVKVLIKKASEVTE